MKRNKGRPTNEEQKKMNCPKETRTKINEMSKRLGFKKGTEIVLMVSISSDEMTHQVHMFPECWFLDCSCNANREKRDLFLLVVKLQPENVCLVILLIYLLVINGCFNVYMLIFLYFYLEKLLFQETDWPLQMKMRLNFSLLIF